MDHSALAYRIYSCGDSMRSCVCFMVWVFPGYSSRYFHIEIRGKGNAVLCCSLFSAGHGLYTSMDGFPVWYLPVCRRTQRRKATAYEERDRGICTSAGRCLPVYDIWYSDGEQSESLVCKTDNKNMVIVYLILSKKLIYCYKMMVTV